MKRLFVFVLLLASFSGIANASSLTVWTVQALRFTTPQLACKAYSSAAYAVQDMGYYWKCHLGPTTAYAWVGNTNRVIYDCPYGHTGTECNATLPTCETGVFDPVENACPPAPVTCDVSKGEELVDGSCVVTNECASKFGQDQSFKLTGNTNDSASPVKKPAAGGQVAMPDVSVAGCAASARQTQCIFYGDGRYACSGTARFTGEKGNTNPALDEPYVEKEPELTNDSSQECSQWVEDAEGRRTKTCQTTSTSEQTGKNTCERGAYDQYCFQGEPSPTPESNTTTRTDNIKETTGADGSKTTETTSTTNKTYCNAGACNTTTTTNKTTVVTGSDGKVSSETGSCSGADCDSPKDPEEEDEEPPTVSPLSPPTGEGGDFDEQGWDEKIESAKGELETAVDSLKGSFSQFTSLGISGAGGSLPCVNTPQILGRTYSFCLSEFQDELLVVGNVIFLIACLFAAFIVFSPKGN